MNEAAMPNPFSFRLVATDGAARTGEIATAHGVVRTPAFMPVGTQAAIKGVQHDDVRASGADILLGNTYHLMLRPAAERVAALGGLHAFMHWPLSDPHRFRRLSGDVACRVAQSRRRRASLSARISTAPWSSLLRNAPSKCKSCSAPTSPCSSTNASHFPPDRNDIERAMATVAALGGALQARIRAARRPAARCSASCRAATIKACARKALRALVDIGFDGYAIGGLAVGETHEVMRKVVAETAPALPADRPRYLMGVGTPADLLAAVARGIDMFDCVLPTRNGRHGLAFTRFGPINIKNAHHADDPRPLDAREPLSGRARFFARIPASPF